MEKFFSAPSAAETSDIALSKFQENLRVEGVKKTDVIDVSFQHEDPVVAAAVLNTLISLYLDRHLDVHQDPQFSGFFGEKPKTLADELQEAEANLDAFRKQYGVSSSPDELRTLLVKEEGDVRATLNQTISLEAETEAQVKQLRAHLKKIPELVNLNKEVEHNPYAISTIRSKLIELQIRERELLNKYNSDNLLVKNVRTEMEEVLTQLSDEEAKVYERSHSGLNAIRQTIQQQLLQKEAELNALKAKSSSLLNLLSTYKQRLDELNHIEVGYYRLKQEVDVNRQNYQFYLGKFAESRISNAMDKERITNVSLIDPARPPSKPVSPKILLNLVLSIFLGGVGSLALAYGMEYFDTRLEKPEDVEAHLKLPVLASIAEFSSSGK
ncbi:GumC family protein [Methylocaldum marinum]|nr:GNVR domain-containing protein [Methylocaldum marinum]